MNKILLLCCLSLLFFSCQGSSNEQMSSVEKSPAPYGMKEFVLEDANSVSSKKLTPEQTQKIIKTGYLTFETESVEHTYQRVSKWVLSNKGMIQSDRTSKEYDRIRRALVVRIPSVQFQGVVDSIVHSVKTLDRKDISKRDVTEEFIDLEARLVAKRHLEARYLQLLTKAKNVKDMLEIERQLANIREEIEAKQGRLNYLQSQVSMSTLHLEFYEMIAHEKPASQTYLSRLWRAAKGGFTGIGNFVIGLVYLWPFIFIGLITVYLVRRLIKKRKKL